MCTYCRTRLVFPVPTCAGKSSMLSEAGAWRRVEQPWFWAPFPRVKGSPQRRTARAAPTRRSGAACAGGITPGSWRHFRQPVPVVAAAAPPTLGPAVGAGRPARRCWRTKWSSPATRPGSKSRTLCDRARRSASLVKSTHLAHHQHLVEELVRLAPVVGHPTLCGSGSAASERAECKGRSRRRTPLSRQPSTFSHRRALQRFGSGSRAEMISFAGQAFGFLSGSQSPV